MESRDALLRTQVTSEIVSGATMCRNLANEKLQSVWRTKLTVACVAETGDYECVLVESLVN